MSKEKHKKTNALRILDTHKVPYNISEYEWSEERAAGLHVAEVLGLDEKKVFKTLVGRGGIRRVMSSFVFPLPLSWI